MSRALPTLLAAALLAGCLGPASTGSGEREWNVARKTVTDGFSFENGGRRAEVQLLWATSQGEAVLRVLDATNATVWYQELVGAPDDQVTAMTGAGEPGAWRVQVEFTGYTGRIAVHVDGRR